MCIFGVPEPISGHERPQQGSRLPGQGLSIGELKRQATQETIVPSTGETTEISRRWLALFKLASIWLGSLE